MEKKKSSSKKKKIIATIVASVAGLSGTAVASMILAYDASFPRQERPNYDIKAGQYVIERMENLKRDELWIPSKKDRLKAYAYMPENPKGLIIFCHGLRSGADDYLPIIEYMYNNGYGVIAHNTTGTYESEGESTVGMCQALVDVDYVIDYVQNDKQYKRLPLFTMGHSCGGYAAASVLSLKKNIKACATIAGVRNASTIMTEKGEQYAGKLAKMGAPVFNVYQKILFGKYCNYDAILGINESNVPVLVAHGVDDKTITFNQQSIIAKKDEITNPNVKYFIGKGLQGGHDSLWHSERAISYQKTVESELKLLKSENDGELLLEQLKEFYKNVDHRLYSEVNAELMDEILALFDGNL